MTGNSAGTHLMTRLSQIAAREIGRTQKRLVRSGWLRSLSRHEAITFEDGSPLNEPSGDEDPPLLPSGKRPLHALFGDLNACSDSSCVMFRVPGHSD